MIIKIFAVCIASAVLCNPVFAKGKKQVQYSVGANRPIMMKHAAEPGSEEHKYCDDFFREQQRLAQQIQLERLKGTLARMKRENAKNGIHYNLSDDELEEQIRIEREKTTFMIRLQQMQTR